MRLRFEPNKIINYLFVVAMVSMLVAPTVSANAFGVACPQENETYIALFDSCLAFGRTISLSISWALMIGTVLALAKLAVGAVQYSFSTGEPGKLTNARATLTDAFLGIILIASAWVIFAYLATTFPSQWDIDLLFFDLT